ncbi:hypothetical protein PU629_14215 [Pullulanibacillus sp. KACC 23026]|uniref:hypothetical protein n=1 Tax=Pullulanibacillus sp. KACC 23026 TaxID=3028315 RepID=UPI0023B0ABC1|nr:hypothetical protein [Pullulanibacillus sp. KACC 23026]WEG11315.1 hypothetical protein PU629_14215 [Pullulanibacillus sp. KACC 23026]
MPRPTNNVHVFNFGHFYLPSYIDLYEEDYREEDLDSGTMVSWEGQLDPTYSDPESHDYKWPII